MKGGRGRLDRQGHQAQGLIDKFEIYPEAGCRVLSSSLGSSPRPVQVEKHSDNQMKANKRPLHMPNPETSSSSEMPCLCMALPEALQHKSLVLESAPLQFL